MSDRKAVRKVNRRNPNLRLVKNDDGKPKKTGKEREEKLRGWRRAVERSFHWILPDRQCGTSVR